MQIEKTRIVDVVQETEDIFSWSHTIALGKEGTEILDTDW